MYILDKICSKNIYLNEFIKFIKNKKSKNNFQGANYKEARLKFIEKKLNEVEYSIISYDQYK